jgi:hypothetical protein
LLVSRSSLLVKTSIKNPATSIQFIHIEWGAHGVLTKNNFYAKNFTPLKSITYIKKPLVVGVPFSHGARTFALRVESVFF